jgi:hypothetical protein
MAEQQISREELYNLVWTQPLSLLAKRFEISDVRLGKVCTEANIPKPGVGYWAKREAGKSTIQPQLPQRMLGQMAYITFGECRDWGTEAYKQRLLTEPLPPQPSFSENLDTVKQRANEIAQKIPVKKTLSNPHQAIATLLAKDNERKEKQKSSGFAFSWNAPLYDSPSGRRRLSVLNSLLLALSHCGGKASASRVEIKDLHVRIGDQPINFELSILETPKKKTTSPPEKERLKVAISWWKAPSEIRVEWMDETDLPLEDQIKDIAAGFLVAAEWMHRTNVLYRHELHVERKQDLEAAIQREREKAIQLEQERLAKIEEEKRQQLFTDASNWHKASELRAYIKAALAQSHDNLSEQERLQMQEWQRWALSEADRLDPLKPPTVR